MSPRSTVVCLIGENPVNALGLVDLSADAVLACPS